MEGFGKLSKEIKDSDELEAAKYLLNMLSDRDSIQKAQALALTSIAASLEKIVHIKTSGFYDD